MKILTNIQSVQIGGITQHLSSFREYLDNNKVDVQVVGIDILRKYNSSTEPLSKREIKGQFTFISQEVQCRKIQEMEKGQGGKH